MGLYEKLVEPDKRLVDKRVETLLKEFKQNILPKGDLTLSEDSLNTMKMAWRESLSTPEILAKLRDNKWSQAATCAGGDVGGNARS